MLVFLKKKVCLTRSPVSYLYMVTLAIFEGKSKKDFLYSTLFGIKSLWYYEIVMFT
jgi:hypothetical protein